MRPLLLSVPGVLLFAWPFLGLGLPPEAPAIALALGCVVAVGAFEAGARQLDSRRLALLAALAAIDAALRLIVVEGIGGFSPIFFLILCFGFVFGPGSGFLLGAATILVSALITGGVGPWLPYQVFATGWMGAAAGVLGMLAAGSTTRRWIVGLAALGLVTGYLFGALLDVWDWSFFRGSGDIGWVPGLPAGVALTRFARFYVTTSFVYDSFRAVGDAVLVLALGPAVIFALARFRARFSFRIVPA
jgi:energy-coupling factor transport system substrate-specific component